MIGLKILKTSKNITQVNRMKSIIWDVNSILLKSKKKQLWNYRFSSRFI